MADDTLIGSTDVAIAIERAAAKYRHEQEIEDARARGPKPEPHPLPTKEEAWRAFAHGLADQDEPIDAAARERFERWWRNEI